VSVWKNIDRFQKGLGDWFKDVGLAVAAPYKFVWDITTAPWNDREEFNGATNTIKQAGVDYAKNIGRPIGGALAGIYQTNKNILWEPLAAVGVASKGVSLSTQTPEEVKEAWKKAWEARQEISLGQAYAGYTPWSYALEKGAALTGQKEKLPLVLKEEFDIFDPAQREKAYNESLYGKASSGIIDFWKQLTLDVSLGAGRLVKTFRKPDDPIEALAGIDEALTGANNKYAKMANDFANNPSFWAQNHPWVQKSNNIGIVSHLLGEASTKDEALYTMAAVLGDPLAVTKLDELKRPDIAEPIRIANGELTRSELKRLLRDERSLGRTQEEDMLSLSYLRTPEEIAADTEFLQAYAKHDKYISALMGVTEQPPVTQGVATAASVRIARESTSARAEIIGGKKIEGQLIEAYQPTPFHRLYYKVTNPFREETPSGLANLNDGDSIKEFTATVNRLVRKNLISPVQGVGLISRYAASATPESKLDAIKDLESVGFGALGSKHKLSQEQIDAILNQHRRLKDGFLKEHKEVGYVYDSIEDANIKYAVFESQTADFYPIADFDLIDDVLLRNQSAFKTAWAIKQDITFTAEFVSDLWKASVLLRGGYPIRNAIDSQLRIMSVLGAMTTVKHLGPGMKRLVENQLNNPPRLIDNIVNYKKGVKQPSYATIKNELQRAGGEVTIHQAKIKQLDAELKLNPDDPDLMGQLVAEKLKLDAKLAVYNTNNESLTALEKAKQKPGKVTLGQEDIQLQSMYTTPDGVDYRIHGSFGGPLGPMWRDLVSSERSMSRILEDYNDLYKGKIATGTRAKITPDMDNYYKEWADGINKAFGNSAVVKELLKPDMDIFKVAKWLEESPAGIKLRTRLGIPREESLSYVGTVQNFMNWYMPPGTGIVDEVIKTGKVTEGFLRDAIKDPTKLPTVHGFLLDENIFRTGKNVVTRGINKAFKVIGSMPEDAWARNPLFDALYQASAQRRFNTAEYLNQKSFTVEELNSIYQRVEAGARADAMKGVREILYNVERRSVAADALRLVSPFFSAQQNAIQTWLRLAIDNPVIFNRAAVTWNAPNSLGLIADEEGNPVPPYKTLDGNEIIWLQVPDSIKKLPLIGKGLESLDNVGISKRSIDVIFMGNPLSPGIGPFAAIPISKIMQLKPDTEAVLNWAFPFGPDTSLTQLFPTWARRVIEKGQGMDNSSYARLWTTIYLTEQQKARESKTPYKTDIEITEMTNALYNTRMWANLILPFAPQFNSPYRLHIEKYRQYSEKFGLNADAKFLEDYPEFFSFALSLSKNRTGSDATMTDVKNAVKYKGIISKVYDDNPELVGLITRGSKGAAFSPTAYWWQEETSITPGTKEKFRGAVDPKEAIRRNQAREGWVRYRKIQAYIDIELRRRKLPNVDAEGATDLKILKQATISNLANETDPVTGQKTGEVSAWYTDFMDRDGTKTARTVQGLRKIVQDPTFMQDNADNPTWKSVIVYLQARDMTAKLLSTRKSKDINAKENQDLKILITATALRLKAEDIGFSDLYDRYLEQDRVYDKNLGVGN
jgi:hypothetical protein